MRLLSGEGNQKRIIREPTVNRPGLALSGFTQYFAYKRVQVFGNAEVFYLRTLTRQQREDRLCLSLRLQDSVCSFQPGFETGQGIFGSR